MITQETKDQIKQAFLNKELKVQTVDPITGEVSLQPVTDVLQHEALHKKIVRVTTEDGRKATFTTDHSLFYKMGSGILPICAGDLREGDLIVTIENQKVTQTKVSLIEVVPHRPHMYDLSVPGPQNFMLSNGILAHNSYSIGGISLDIERSSKYEGLKGNAESQFEKGAETKARTTKIIRGLQQSRYGTGIRSAFGPAVGRGVLSPRNFI